MASEKPRLPIISETGESNLFGAGPQLNSSKKALVLYLMLGGAGRNGDDLPRPKVGRDVWKHATGYTKSMIHSIVRLLVYSPRKIIHLEEK